MKIEVKCPACGHTTAFIGHTGTMSEEEVRKAAESMLLAWGCKRCRTGHHDGYPEAKGVLSIQVAGREDTGGR